MSTCAELQHKLQTLQTELLHVTDDQAQQKIEDEIEQVIIEQHTQGCLKQQSPWAVLLCKFQDNQSETPVVNPDFRTVCERFFTTPSTGFNAVQFFSDMSHGNVDLSGSQVLGWYTLNVNVNDVVAPTDPPPPGWVSKKSQNDMMTLAKQAARGDLDQKEFFGVVLIMNVATGWAQGHYITAGGNPEPGVWADWRRVDGRRFDGSLGPRGIGSGNGTEVFGQEMGHGYGLGHSRRDGSDEDYQDAWDIMSTAAITFAEPDPDYCARGPGLNAWNMRGRGWLDESRVWRGPGGLFDQVIQLRPLHRRDLAGLLAAELPPNDGVGGHGRYLVEFRVKEVWDAGIPRSAVFVHRFLDPAPNNDGDTGRSYIMSGTRSNQDLVQGDVFAPWGGGGPRLEVQNIDENTKVAIVRLSYAPLMTDVAPGAAAAGDYVFFFAKSIDERIFSNRAKLGQGLEGWVEVGGGGRTNASPAAAAVGMYMFIIAKGPTGDIGINQTGDLGQTFVGWNSANFSTDVAPAAAAAGDYVFFFAKHLDGRIFSNRAKLGQGLEGWIEVGGGGRTNVSPTAAAVGSYMFLAVRGLDGNIYINQTGDLGQTFVGWNSANFSTDVAPAVAAAGDYVFFFAKHLDGRIFSNRAKLGQGLEGWVEVGGGGRTNVSPTAAAVGSYMFLAVRGLDGNIYINQTGDLGQTFTGWSAIT